MSHSRLGRPLVTHWTRATWGSVSLPYQVCAPAERELSTSFLKHDLSYSTTASALGNTDASSSPDTFLQTIRENDKNATNDFAARKREYAKQISELRKKYAADQAEKNRLLGREAKERLDEQARMKAARLITKKEQARVRALEAVETDRAFKAVKAVEREEKANRRRAREEQQGLKKSEALVALKGTSSHWIEEPEFERRVLEAMADQYYL
eukprot:jgi/Mesen1/485/ME001024S10725